MVRLYNPVYEYLNLHLLSLVSWPNRPGYIFYNSHGIMGIDSVGALYLLCIIFLGKYDLPA